MLTAYPSPCNLFSACAASPHRREALVPDSSALQNRNGRNLPPVVLPDAGVTP